MNRIVVAVDFTESSINSLEHALTIASRAGADITMVWVDRMGTSSSLLPEVSMAEHVEEKFKELVEKYKWKLLRHTIEYKIRKGKVHDQIIAEAEESNANLIFTGTHGNSGIEQFLIGSNAYKMVITAPCPIITIRAGTDVNRELKTIVMPIDSTLETRQKVTFTSQIAKIFKAEVHVVCIHTTGVQTVQSLVNSYADQVEKHLQSDKVKVVRAIVRNSHLAKAVLEYCEQVDANLLSIMTEQERTPLMLGNYTSQMINQSPIPVLCIHPTQTMRIFNV